MNSALSPILIVLVQRLQIGALLPALGERDSHGCWRAKSGSTIAWVTLAVAALWIGLCVVALV